MSYKLLDLTLLAKQRVRRRRIRVTALQVSRNIVELAAFLWQILEMNQVASKLLARIEVVLGLFEIHGISVCRKEEKTKKL
jgi:hypothetical protein